MIIAEWFGNPARRADITGNDPAGLPDQSDRKSDKSFDFLFPITAGVHPEGIGEDDIGTGIGIALVDLLDQIRILGEDLLTPQIRIDLLQLSPDGTIKNNCFLI